MLDDDRRKAMAAVGYLGHRASLPMVSPPSYPVILTKPRDDILSSPRQRLAANVLSGEITIKIDEVTAGAAGYLTPLCCAAYKMLGKTPARKPAVSYPSTRRLSPAVLRGTVGAAGRIDQWRPCE